MGKVDEMYSELEEDVLFIADISSYFSLNQGDPTGRQLYTFIKCAIDEIKKLDKIAIFEGPAGDIVKDESVFYSRLLDCISADNIADIEYGYWLDYTDERLRKLSPL